MDREIDMQTLCDIYFGTNETNMQADIQMDGWMDDRQTGLHVHSLVAMCVTA